VIRQLERPFLHPFLFAVYPILLVYGLNQEQLTPDLALVPLALSLLLGLFLLAGSHVLFREAHKDAFFTSLFLILFYAFNQVLILFNSISPVVVFRGRYKVMLFVAVLAVTALLVLRSRWSFKPLTTLLNVAALLLVAFNLLGIVASAVVEPPARPDMADVSPERSPGSDLEGPDIYYIILDGYASARTLKEELGYDNSEFLDFLRDQGFFVVPDSYANYPKTGLSLPSSMNMTYLEPSKEFVTRLHRTSESRIAQLLTRRGYRFVAPSEEWESARLSIRGDGSSSLGDLLRTEFALTLTRMTMLDPILTRLGWYGVRVRRAVLHALEKLREGPDPDLGGPKFAYIYALCPHPPYVFGPDGEAAEEIDFGTAFDVRLSSWDNTAGYVNQVRFINKQLMQIIPELLSKYGDDPPVIIIQGDHGPTLSRGDRSDTDYHRVRLGILNAYRLPRGGNERLYDGITPVNSFRVVLNHYFGEELPLLDDRSYYSAFETPYDLTDVTDQIRAVQP